MFFHLSVTEVLQTALKVTSFVYLDRLRTSRCSTITTLPGEVLIEDTLNVFKWHSNELNFTREDPAGEVLQFSDIRLTVTASQMSWSNCTRPKKSVLLLDSSHSSMVKTGITTCGLRVSPVKSCPH